MKKRRKCIDPSVGGKIPLEIVWPISIGEKSLPQDLTKMPDFSPEVHHHLEICESCRINLEKNLGLWYQKAESGRKTTQAYEIVNEYNAGEPAVLHRKIEGGVALFKPYEDGTRGLFVLLEDPFFINDPEEKTLEEFNRMR